MAQDQPKATGGNKPKPGGNTPKPGGNTPKPAGTQSAKDRSRAQSRPVSGKPAKGGTSAKPAAKSGGTGGNKPRPGRPAATAAKPPRRRLRGADRLGCRRPGHRDHRRAGDRQGLHRVVDHQRHLHADHPGLPLPGVGHHHGAGLGLQHRGGQLPLPGDLHPPDGAHRPAGPHPGWEDAGDALLRRRVVPLLRRRAVGAGRGAGPVRHLERAAGHRLLPHRRLPRDPDPRASRRPPSTASTCRSSPSRPAPTSPTPATPRATATSRCSSRPRRSRPC